MLGQDETFLDHAFSFFACRFLSLAMESFAVSSQLRTTVQRVRRYGDFGLLTFCRAGIATLFGASSSSCFYVGQRVGSDSVVVAVRRSRPIPSETRRWCSVAADMALLFSHYDFSVHRGDTDDTCTGRVFDGDVVHATRNTLGIPHQLEGTCGSTNSCDVSATRAVRQG